MSHQKTTQYLQKTTQISQNTTQYLRNTSSNVPYYVMQDFTIQSIAIRNITPPAIMFVVFAHGNMSREWMCFLSALTASRRWGKLTNIALDMEQPWTEGRFLFVIIFSVGLISRLYYSFYKSTMPQKCLCVLRTIDCAITDKEEGMQTVTMPKFTRPFNKNWKGQAAGGAIELCGTPFI